MPYTYAILDVTSATFREIQNKLEAAGYQHAFGEDSEGQLVIDLHGVAIRDEDGDEGPAVGAPLERACHRHHERRPS